MAGYLQKFIEGAQYTETTSFLPKGICPFLFYNLSPYVFTLTEGGWFDWVIHRQDSYRKAIKGEDFRKKSVNSLYPNEVLVRCPNPYVNVVAGLGLWLKDEIKIRILHSELLCLNQHKIGEEILLDKNEAKILALGFNRVFTNNLILSLRGKSSPIDKCTLDYNLAVKVAKIIFPCRYHKRKREFHSSFLPDGFCLHLFQTIYPQIVAVMFNAKMDKEFSIECPLKKCTVTLSLDKTCRIKNKFIKSSRRVVEKMFALFFHPLESLDYDLKIKVLTIENKSSECLLRIGKEYPVNLRSEDFICPTSFHVLYPYLALACLGEEVPWNGCNQRSGLIPCPDCVGIVYSINRYEQTNFKPLPRS